MLFGRKYFPRIIEYSVISVKKSAWMQCRLSADRRVSPVISTPQWSCIYRVKCMYWTLVVAIFDAGDMTLSMERQTCIKSRSRSLALFIDALLFLLTLYHSMSLCTFPALDVFWFSFHCSNEKNVTHILSLFIVTVTIMASCRCRCRRWQCCCCCCCGCCRCRRLQSHAKWITFSLLSESSRFFIVH